MCGQKRWIPLLFVITVVCCKPLEDVVYKDSNLLNSQYEQRSVQLKDTAHRQAVREQRDINESNETPEIRVNKTSSNESSFENYEKEYLINLTMNLLKEFLHYEHYVKHIKEENSSVHKGTSTHKPDTTISPGGPTPLPHTGDNTTPDVVRIDTRILQQKLSELNQMNVDQLTRVFNSLHRAAEKGVEDPGITSLCCNIG